MSGTSTPPWSKTTLLLPSPPPHPQGLAAAERRLAGRVAGRTDKGVVVVIPARPASGLGGPRGRGGLACDATQRRGHGPRSP